MGRNCVTTILAEDHRSTLAAVFAAGVLALLIGLPDIFTGIECLTSTPEIIALPFIMLGIAPSPPRFGPRRFIALHATG